VRRAADALAIARGEVRDGVASIEHFLEVLGSRRVGPRVLARGVPEVLAGCVPLRAALTALVDALDVELAADAEGLDASRSLLAHAAARIDELAAALEAQRGASLDARERLALEAVVRRVAGELGTVVRLVDLLGAAVTSETTTIDLGDALAHRRLRPRQGATRILASVDVRVSELTVGDARMVLDLLELAVTTVVRAGVAAPCIVVDLGPEGFPVFRVDDGARGHDPRPQRDSTGMPPEAAGQVLEVVLRDELPREPDVVRAAARRAGIALAITPDRRAVTIAL
jgi:hypothetical protein